MEHLVPQSSAVVDKKPLKRYFLDKELELLLELYYKFILVLIQAKGKHFRRINIRRGFNVTYKGRQIYVLVFANNQF